MTETWMKPRAGVDLHSMIKRQGLTHDEVAERAGCNRPAITRIARGQRKCSPLLAMGIAGALGRETEAVFQTTQGDLEVFQRRLVLLARQAEFEMSERVERTEHAAPVERAGALT